MQKKYLHAISWPCLLLPRFQQLKRDNMLLYDLVSVNG